MTKQIDRIEFCIEYDVVAATKRLVFCIHDVGDTANSDKYIPVGSVNVGDDDAPRNLTGGELAGTVETFISTTMKGEAETAEGI